LALRKYGKGKLTIGYAPTFGFVYPQTENERDIEAARRYNYSMHFDQHNWAWNLVWWSDPVYLGSYPADGLEVLGKYLPDTWEEDLKIINQPLDFVGQNFYNGLEVKADENGNAEFIERYEGHPRTAIGWPITPRAIKWLAKFLYERYKLPVLITENGISCADVISLDGKVHDPNRIDYVTRYLRALNEAVEEGVELDGYFYWSIMDNFEWAKGFSERFGLIYIDYPTQQRIIKDSGYWFKSVIESNGENIL
jgi:beta-glucosidase